MSHRKEPLLVEATSDILAKVEALAKHRQALRHLEASARMLQQELVEFIGDADGLTGPGLEARLARCSGQVSWKGVAEELRRQLDIPPSLFDPAVEGSRGDPYVRLTVRELDDVGNAS